MIENKKRRVTTLKDDTEFEFECGKCKHSVVVGPGDSGPAACPECEFTGRNIFRLMSEEDAATFEAEREERLKKREQYEEKLASVGAKALIEGSEGAQ